MKKITFLSLMLFSAFFSSCSDDPTNPSENCSLENSLKLQTGNYWIYNTVETDMSGAEIQASTAIDSVIVDGTRIIAGKTAYSLTTHRRILQNDSIYSFTAFYAIEDSKAYALLASLTPGLYENVCDCYPVQWVKFADCGEQNWKSIDLRVPSDTLDAVNPTTGEKDIAVFQWYYNANGKFLSNETLDAANKTVNAKSYQTTGTFTYSILLPLNAQFAGGVGTNDGRDLPFQINQTVWLSEGIGIVKFESKAFDRYIGPDPVNIVNGIRKTLIRYSVK